MADLRRVCKGCKRQFRPRKATRRLYCETCRPSRVKPIPEPEPAAAEVASVPGECERTVRGVLEDADRLSSVPGVLAIRLARQLDDPRLPGAQASSLARQVEDLVAKAMVGVKPPADFVDDIAARRRA